MRPPSVLKCSRKVLPANLRTLHRTFRHAPEESLKKVMDYYELRVQSASNEKDVCESCIQASFPNAPFKLTGRRATRTFERLHMDLVVKLPIAVGGASHVLVVRDEYSGYLICRSMEMKREAEDIIKEIVAWGECQSGNKVKIIQADQGGEFTSNSLSA